jgi:hypothetical protein
MLYLGKTVWEDVLLEYDLTNDVALIYECKGIRGKPKSKNCNLFANYSQKFGKSFPKFGERFVFFL